MKTKLDFLIGVPILLALLACGGSSEKVVVESPSPEPVYVPASAVEQQPKKVKKTTTYPDGTQVETEVEVEDD
jgi:hypothetical protein